MMSEKSGPTDLGVAREDSAGVVDESNTATAASSLACTLRRAGYDVQAAADIPSVMGIAQTAIRDALEIQVILSADPPRPSDAAKDTVVRYIATRMNDAEILQLLRTALQQSGLDDALELCDILDAASMRLGVFLSFTRDRLRAESELILAGVDTTQF